VNLAIKDYKETIDAIAADVAEKELFRSQAVKELEALKSKAFRRMIWGCIFCFAIGWIMAKAFN
jgi:hypothetical protein